DVGPVAGADLAPRLGALGRLDAVWHLGPLAMTGEITLTRGVPTDPPLRWGLGGVILFSRGLEIGAGGGAAGSARAAEVWLRVRR
ncbi:MAG TPA: hypothetical protein PKA64_08415, partial [Myxococcota bacterium]|nr:hypothetical protein [Myxococcota bacterium]